MWRCWLNAYQFVHIIFMTSRFLKITCSLLIQTHETFFFSCNRSLSNQNDQWKSFASVFFCFLLCLVIFLFRINNSANQKFVGNVRIFLFRVTSFLWRFFFVVFLLFFDIQIGSLINYLFRFLSGFSSLYFVLSTV